MFVFVPQTNDNLLFFCFRILRQGEISCPVKVMSESQSYVCKVKNDPNGTFEDFDFYLIKLCHESGCYNVTKKPFQPCVNSKYDLIIIIV